uniref:Glutenin, low molecular weight subunit n=1 Tax=Steinernema glaseri TaxID=37863 RepID=A0A1I7XZN5_9BILA
MFRSSQKQVRTPTMKVFTVGLDQKAPMEKQPEPPTEVLSVAPGTPPPMYASEGLRRKKPYKSILLCMLGIFLLMLFVVTLSEMAYNRERDQNFLRLRWAELKQRMGYYDSYNNGITDRLSAHRISPVQSFAQMEATTVATTSTEPSTTKAPEVEPANDDEPSGLDARLGFLQSILSKIKEKAEELGMDGTMQVSVIQMEPEGMSHDNDYFKDGFGEVAHPHFSHNNDAVDDGERPMFGPWISEVGHNQEIPDMFQQPARFGFGPNQEMNRFPHPFEGNHEFEGRQPAGQFMGEMYGRRFGRLLQELLARRMNNFQDMTPVEDNAQFNPRFGQQMFWPGAWQQQEQQPQWWWNQPQPQVQPQPQQWWGQQQQQQPQQWWGQQQQQQQQPWTFDSQQPQRAQNHPEHQQLPPMIAMPQENQWAQQQQMIQRVPQIPQMPQGNDIFQQQVQQPQFQMFPQQNFGQQAPQIQNQNQQPAQASFVQMPFINPSENIQIDPPHQQKPINDEWKPWGQEHPRAWTHQNAEQSVPQVPQIQPEANPWQIPQSQPSLEPSAPFDVSNGNLNALNDAPKTGEDSFKIDFPAVKFPVNDELNQQNQMNQHIDPRFFQIDEPQASQSESI